MYAVYKTYLLLFTVSHEAVVSTHSFLISSRLFPIISRLIPYLEVVSGQHVFRAGVEGPRWEGAMRRVPEIGVGSVHFVKILYQG